MVPSLGESVLTSGFVWVVPRVAKFLARGDEAVRQKPEALESVERAFGSRKRRIR